MFKKIAFILVGILCLIWGVHQALINHFKSFKDYPLTETPKGIKIKKMPFKINVLFTYGMEQRRYWYSHQLFKENDPDIWIISEPHNFIFDRQQKHFPLRKNSILGLYNMQSTWEESLWLIRYLHNLNLPKGSNVTIVSSLSHLPRIQWILDSKLEAFEIKYLPVPQSYYDHNIDIDPSDWWKFSNLRLEGYKTVFYWFFYS